MPNHDAHVRWADLVMALLENLPQSQLARRLGVDPKQVSRWAKDSHQPTGQNAEGLLKFADELCIDPGLYRGSKPVYDIHQTFEKNCQSGPPTRAAYKYQIPKLPTLFAGHSLDSPLGVAASVITADSRWIKCLAENGFDILTYKTVRTVAHPPHNHPNIVYLPELNYELDPSVDFQNLVVSAAHDLPSLPLSELSLANSLGIPSSDPVVWQRDVEQARKYVGSKQLLIVSVVGTSHKDEDLLADFVKCAILAHEAGAQAIELNCSCPNTYAREEGLIFRDPEIAGKLARQVRTALPKCKIFLKLGPMDGSVLTELFVQTFRFVDGYTAINTLPLTIVSPDAKEEPVFSGTQRTKAGVSGAAIRKITLETVGQLNVLRANHRLDIEIIGVGGVTTANHVQELLDRGANAVLFATSPMHNLEVAIDVRKTLTSNGYAKPHSRFLHHRDRTPSFSDDLSSHAFDLTVATCIEEDFPVDNGLLLLVNNWSSRYLRDLDKIRSSESQVRTRAEKLSKAEVLKWIRYEKNRK